MANLIQIQILILTIYGDLIKRVIPNSFSLGIIYFWVILILIQVVFFQHRAAVVFKDNFFAVDCFLKSVFLCILIYVIQLLFAPLITREFDLIKAASGAFFVILPLAFIVVFYRTEKKSFELESIIFWILLMMLPVNIVGFVQYVFDSNFMISGEYVETGGTIMRNFHGGRFARIPSVYVSADRYSAMGLVQVFLSLAVLISLKKNSANRYLWIFFNLLCGALALAMAGARSRMLIFMVLVIVLVLFLLKVNKLLLILKKSAVVILFMSICFGGIYFFMPEKFAAVYSRMKSVESVDFIMRSFEDKDIQKRVGLAFHMSRVRDESSFLGNGLGTFAAAGRPPEFAIQGFWAEGGLLFGGVTLCCFISVIWMLFVLAVESFRRRLGSYFIIFLTGALVLSTGVLTGLSSGLEISSGVLLCMVIGIAARDLRMKKFIEWANKHATKTS